MNIVFNPGLFSFALGALVMWVVLENPDTATALWELLLTLLEKLGLAFGELLDLDNDGLKKTGTVTAQI